MSQVMSKLVLDYVFCCRSGKGAEREMDCPHESLLRIEMDCPHESFL